MPLLTYFAITCRGPVLCNWCEDRDCFLSLQDGSQVNHYVMSPPLSSSNIVWHTRPSKMMKFVTHVGIMEGGEYELMYTVEDCWHSQWTGERVEPVKFVSSIELLAEEVDF